MKWLTRAIGGLLETSGRVSDVLILACFIILITFNPYYLRSEVNIFEMGLYLPGIDAILKGEIPYRDFFHLRGPFELYLPAFMMVLFGKNVAVLSTCFYIGTIATLLFGVLIGRELFRSRLFFYLMVPVLVARAFPRVSFAIGGGMRFAYGVMAVFCAVKFFKTRKMLWLWLSGAVAAAGLWTSIEIGVFAFISVTGALFFEYLLGKKEAKNLFSEILSFIGGACIISLPFMLYFYLNQALGPFADSVYYVVVNMVKVFPQIDPAPRTLLETLQGMVNPEHANFKQLTPIYCYLFIAALMAYRAKRKQLREIDFGIICLVLYGIMMYLGAFFRSLGGPAFEMALQQEKIILFLLLEEFFSFTKPFVQPRQNNPKKIYLVNLLFIVVVVWSISYSVDRFNKRFFAFQFIRYALSGKDVNLLKPLSGQKAGRVNLDRLKGMTFPMEQARDLIELNNFIKNQTKPKDAILAFPDMAAYNFIVDRPFVGRFPMVLLSWIGPSWHEEFMVNLKKNKPSCIVTRKKLPDYFDKSNFTFLPNKEKYNDVMDFIQSHYKIVSSTPSFNIYGLK